MTNPLIYFQLGGHSQRKLRFRDKVVQTALSHRERGLPTRIPFLKAELLAQDVPSGLTSKETEPVSSFPEGFVLSVPKRFNILTIPDYSGTIIHFNAANVPGNLQFIPTTAEKGEFRRFVVFPCDSYWIGDLIVSKLREMAPIFHGRGDGFFNPNFFQIFLKHDVNEKTEKTLAHEKEHAIHISLWRMIGLPISFFNTVDAEYLSILSALIQRNCAELVAGTKWYPKKNFRLNALPYHLASLRFIYHLRTRYGMRGFEVDLAICATYDDVFEEGQLDQESFDYLRRMKEAAQNEYERTYQRIFGLSLDEIREVIAGLPMI